MNVEIGDIFIKAGNPPTRWYVERFLEFEGMPKHVRLRNEMAETSMITVAISVLSDRSSFQKNIVSG